MNYKEFITLLKKNEFRNVYLFYGNERYLINWAVDAIKKKYVREEFENLNFNSVDIRQMDADGIINICETLPIMSEKRVVLIDGYSVLEGEKVKNFNESNEKKFSSYLEGVSDSSIVILVCQEKLDKRKSTYKKINKTKGVFEFSKLTRGDLKKWVEKRIKSAKKTISQKNIMLLIENSGYLQKNSNYTLFNMENDINKLLNYRKDADEIIESDIIDCISVSLERNIFVLIDAIATKDKALGVNLLSQALLYGEAEYKILALIQRQFDHMLQVKIMREKGKDISDIKQQLGLPDFIIKKLVKNASGFTLNALKQNMIRMYEMDKNIKTGVMDPRLALEMLVVQM